MKFITIAALLLSSCVSTANAKPLDLHNQLVRGFQASTLKAGITFTVYTSKIRKSDVSISLREVREGARMRTKGKGMMFTQDKIVLQYLWKGDLQKQVTILVKPRDGRNGH